MKKLVLEPEKIRSNITKRQTSFVDCLVKNAVMQLTLISAIDRDAF